MPQLLMSLEAFNADTGNTIWIQVFRSAYLHNERWAETGEHGMGHVIKDNDANSHTIAADYARRHGYKLV